MAVLSEAYPSLRTYIDETGIWLLVTSSVLAELDREAIFLVAVPYRPGIAPRAWAFWNSDGDRRWIGPRHTNFHDGSVCAFAPDDGAWQEGGDLRTLIDLYSVWALRHLHLEAFDRWPGRQYSLSGTDPRVSAYYRLIECKGDELCGCGTPSSTYAECCRPADRQRNLIELAAAFSNQIPGGFASRTPPKAVVEIAEGAWPPPPMREVHIQLSS